MPPPIKGLKDWDDDLNAYIAEEVAAAAPTAAVVDAVLSDSGSDASVRLAHTFPADPAPAIEGVPLIAYGDSFAAEYGMFGSGWLSMTVAALAMESHINRAASGSSGRGISTLALSTIGAHRWVARSDGVVVMHCGLNDSREFDLTDPANAKYVKAYRNSLRIMATLTQGQERVDWEDPSWAFTGGAWTEGAYPFTSSGTLKATSVADNSAAVITFTGTEISVILGHGIGSAAQIEARMDGELIRTVTLQDEFTPGTGEGVIIGWAVQRFGGLGAGEHTLEIRHVGGASGLAVDSYVLPSQAAPQLKLVEATYMAPDQYGQYPPFDNGSDASVNKTREVMADVAAEFSGVTVVPATNLTPIIDFQDDLVHPNEAGATKLAATLQGVLTTRPNLTKRVADILGSKDAADTIGRIVEPVLGRTYAAKATVEQGTFSRLAIQMESHVNETDVLLDATYGVHQIVQFFTDIASMAVINPHDQQEVSVMHYRAANEVMVWPTNFRWANNTAPAAPAGGTRNYYRLTYNADTDLWYESAARVLGVPQT